MAFENWREGNLGGHDFSELEEYVIVFSMLAQLLLSLA
jgi:hypothetical protein